MRQILESAPDLAAIHPWDHAGADEEIMLLEYTFLSTMQLSAAYVPELAKWILSATMLLGRLEILAVLVLVTPSLWRG